MANWNRIRAPFTIKPGQRLYLSPPPGYRKPVAAAPVVASRQPVGRPARPPQKPVQQRPEIRPSAASPASVTAYPDSNVLSWQWPTAGRIVASFSDGGAGKSGIDIQGRAGQPVVAAAGGKVVYSGNNLKGYGELIIIKHSEELLSAYAYNRKRLVQEGTWAVKGQRIAELGGAGKNPPLLHFEIRKQGQPVDPLNYLPRLPKER